MNRLPFKSLLVGVVLTAGIATTSCNSKDKNTNNTGTDTSTTMNAPAEQAPVTINEDETMNRGLVDATKDYPGVNATVNNGEITLTGTLERSKLPDLMTSLNSLRPKKINNNLTLK